MNPYGRGAAPALFAGCSGTVRQTSGGACARTVDRCFLYSGGDVMNVKQIMTDLPESDRPYEKLELHGAYTLTDSELLAVIIRAGTGGANAVTVARQLLKSFGGSLRRVCDAGIPELAETRGIGRIKAIQLKAAGEIADRINREKSIRLVDAANAEAVGRMLMYDIGSEKREVFRVLMLDKRLRIISARDVSSGVLDRTLVHPREVFSPAVRELAYAVIVAHNHPSGELEPSEEDVRLTDRLVEAGEILGIPVLDHFIVSARGFTSFCGMGLMAKSGGKQGNALTLRRAS